MAAAGKQQIPYLCPSVSSNTRPAVPWTPAEQRSTLTEAGDIWVKGNLYLTMHSTHFIYIYKASDIDGRGKGPPRQQEGKPAVTTTGATLSD